MFRWILLAALLGGWSSCWGQDEARRPREELNQLYVELSQYYDLYGQKVVDEPDNDGAKGMRRVLSNALNAVDAYKVGEGTPERVQRAASDGYKEAKRYRKSEDAQKVRELFAALRELAPNLPPVAGAKDLPPVAPAPEEPRVVVGAPATPYSTAESSQRYWELALAGLLTFVLVSGLFVTLLRLQGKRFAKQVKALTKRLETAEDLLGEGGDTAFQKVQAAQLERRLESLEENTTEFLAALENRISDAGAGDIAALERRLKSLERRLGSDPSTTLSGPDAAPQEQEVAQQCIALFSALRTRVTSTVLQTQIAEQLPQLEKTASSAAELDSPGLARTVQLVFIAAQNEDQTEAYAQLVEVCSTMGWKIEDQLVGRQAFSDRLANNVPIDTYFTRDTYATAAYPRREHVKALIESDPKRQGEIKNTVLAVLFPTVTTIENGAQRILAKGTYVVAV